MRLCRCLQSSKKQAHPNIIGFIKTLLNQLILNSVSIGKRLNDQIKKN